MGRKDFSSPCWYMYVSARLLSPLHLESLLVQQPQTNSATMAPCCTFVRIESLSRLFLAEVKMISSESLEEVVEPGFATVAEAAGLLEYTGIE